MSKIIGLSGAQGAGKSTLLSELEVAGYCVDKFKVSRAVQASLGWESLTRVLDSYYEMIDFQDEVFRQKYKNDQGLINHDPDIILVERTFADIYAYTTHWVWKFVERGDVSLQSGMEFLLGFADKCAAAQQEIYAGTILLPLMSHVQWENDSFRADVVSAGQIYEDVERFIDRKLPITSRKFTITAASLADRTMQAHIFLQSICSQSKKA